MCPDIHVANHCVKKKSVHVAVQFIYSLPVLFCLQVLAALNCDVVLHTAALVFRVEHRLHQSKTRRWELLSRLHSTVHDDSILNDVSDDVLVTAHLIDEMLPSGDVKHN